MISKSSITEFLKDSLSPQKRPKLLMILGICGILLIFLSTVIPESPQNSKNQSNGDFKAIEYRQMLEESVKNLVKEISGDKNASVVITLDSGVRYSYADATEISSSSADGDKQKQNSKSENKSYITVETADGGEQALLITEYMPDIRGVAVVCKGGNDEQTAEKIKSAVMAALQITSNRVYITGGNIYEKEKGFR